jgi:hypothetical protein
MNSTIPILVYRNVSAHLGMDMTRLADLYVRPSEVSIEIKRHGFSRDADGTVVIQRGGRIQLNVCRLPPWSNTELFITGQGQYAHVALTQSQRGPLVTALKSAGFDVDIQKRISLTLWVL